MFSAGLVLLVTDLLRMVGFATVLFLVDAHLALITFAVIPLLAAAAFVFRLKVRDAFRAHARPARPDQRDDPGDRHRHEGGPAVHARGAEPARLRSGSTPSTRTRGSSRSGTTRRSSPWWSSRRASRPRPCCGRPRAATSAGTIYVFMDYMRRFFLPLRDLSAKYSVMQSSMASLERIFQLLDTKPGDRRPARGAARAAAPPMRTRRAGEVEFQNVWFAYQGEDWVLRDVSFRVAPGERVAFVGATGAGKTTVIKLLARLYEVSRGRILLDGVDLRAIPQRELRRRVGMVLQDVFLFSGTIEDNLALGRAGARPRAHPARRRGGRGRPLRDAPAGRLRHRSARARRQPVAPASASCSRSRARSRTARTCSCWTRRPARSTPRPRR